jgi:hypothetical protein
MSISTRWACGAISGLTTHCGARRRLRRRESLRRRPRSRARPFLPSWRPRCLQPAPRAESAGGAAGEAAAAASPAAKRAPGRASPRKPAKAKAAASRAPAPANAGASAKPAVDPFEAAMRRSFEPGATQAPGAKPTAAKAGKHRK